jgi:uncharacterized membrane protein YjgN (DUF898 family)
MELDTSTPTPEDKNAVNRTAQVNFYGHTSEFFSIWIVNLLLTIVTLGIYSAWATVRTNRYFYSNTEIDGHRLSYLAEPLQILKGRLIAFGLLILYYVTNMISPAAAIAVVLLLVIASPLLICLSVRFKMRMTAYRNVRFNFTGSYGQAFVTFLLLPLVGVFTLYLAMPWVLKKMDEFVHSHITFGDKSVNTELETSAYYIAALGSAAIGTVVIVVLVLIFELFSGVSVDELANPESAALVSFLGIFMIIAYLLMFSLASSFYTAYIRNHLFNTSTVEHVAGFTSNVNFVQLCLLQVTNLLALVCSVGFAMPWVKIRMARFYADATQVKVLNGADSVVADTSQSASSIADEVSGAFDIDVAIG